MADNMDVVVSKAECCLLEHNPRRAYELSKWVHEKVPFQNPSGKEQTILSPAALPDQAVWQLA